MTRPTDRDYDTLAVTRPSPGTVHLKLDRRRELNAITVRLLDELEESLDALRRDDETQVLIVSGAGNRAFSVGADLDVIEGTDPATARELSRRGQRTFGALERFPGPVLACVEGYCLGGGMELATCADIRVAGPDATFGQPEQEHGLIPGWGGTQRLPRLLGEGRAMEVILTADEYDADTMVEYGFVTEISETPFERVRDRASSLAEGSRMAQEFAKRAVRGDPDRSTAGFEFESLAFSHLIEHGAPVDD